MARPLRTRPLFIRARIVPRIAVRELEFAIKPANAERRRRLGGYGTRRVWN